ncbi:zinc finger protein 320-like [Cydia amplana]|uniref:zinc finger protein 320-like n=1 Tax=Cydia amplana TaxID=1869771 RepID=UPI002FE66B74
MRQLDLCRCCLAVGCDKDISEEYEEDGRKEIYSDMLLDTFNIFISYEDVGGKCQICEDCISRLRESAAFKAQVIEAGKAITQKLKNTRIESEGDEVVRADENIKMEVCEEVELSYEDFDFTQFTGGNDDDEIYIIKLEDGSCVAGAGDEISALADNLRRNEITRGLLGSEVSVKTPKHKPVLKPKKEKPKKTQTEVTQRHLDMRANSLKLVRNSNMCLFKAGRGKFSCFYCFQSYPDMTQLREHSKTHSHTKELVIKINPVSHLCYKKADISSLHCARCLEPCESIEALQQHLTIIHDFTFSDDGHLLIPFKLDNGNYCAICNLLCNTFVFLSMHMNSHFPNYVCETCGAAYINFKNLDVHRRVVHLRKCKKCLQDNCTCKEVKLGGRHNSRMCLECNITFKYSYLYKEHNYQVHGAKRPIATCNICAKTFLTPNNLKLHVRRIHNAERNHVCRICDMSFFTAHGMRKHIRRTHTDVEIKPYSCDYCACKFKMKYSLSKHLKNRHGRRMDGRLFNDVGLTLEEMQGK